jgi:hypothetical protein
MYTPESIREFLAQLRLRARRIDWRVWAVVTAMAVAVIATACIYASGMDLSPTNQFGAVFAAWVGGVILFVVAGVVVAIVSLAKPEQESFDARARILFRRQTGTHIDYIVGRIKNILEHYSEHTTIKATLESYHEEEKKYRMVFASTVTVRSYLDDIRTSYRSNVEYTGVTPAPAGEDPNRLIFLRVDNKPTGTPVDFTNAITRDVDTTIDPDEACNIEYLLKFWIAAEEEANTHSPKRYTQLLHLSLENLTKFPKPIKVKLTRMGATDPEIIELPSGECKLVLEVKGVPPGVQAYDFRVLAPTP